jgi:hypothetical protein
LYSIYLISSLAFGSVFLVLPAKANVQSTLALINVIFQDITVLSAPQNQKCIENSTQAKEDEPLTHILDNIPVLSGNASFGR